ncbi:MAG: carbohydrate deacetylase [Peptostreptococcaceae bacterium]
MTKLIINADDFGYSKAVNYGIIESYKSGVVTSTTIMANMPGFSHAIELIKQNEGLGLGVHMTLSCYKPVSENLKTIVDEEGNFYRRLTDDVLETFNLDEVYNEFCAQIDKVLECHEITHLDSHHHVHQLKILKPVIEKILKKYDLPIRGGFMYDMDYDKIINLNDTFYGENVEECFFEKNLDELKKYDTIDLMVHPAFLDSFILNSTSYANQRTKEYDILTSNVVKKYLDENFELVNYKNR